MAVDLVCLPREAAWRMWPLVRQRIDEGYAASDELMPENIERDLLTGHRVLWLVVDENRDIKAAAITRMIERRSGWAMQIVSCAGTDLQLWRTFEPQFVEYAKAHRCVKLVIKGRRGWLRVLDGYRETECTIEKRVG